MLFFRLLVFSNIDILLSHNIGPFYREFNPILVLFDITLSDFIVIASYFGNFVFWLLFFIEIFFYIFLFFIKYCIIIKEFMDGSIQSVYNLIINRVLHHLMRVHLAYYIYRLIPSYLLQCVEI